jgi:hypothetical protein
LTLLLVLAIVDVYTKRNKIMAHKIVSDLGEV